MLTPTTRTNIRRLVAVVTAGGVCGLAGSYALASAEQTPTPTGHDQRAVAEWANCRGLTGLSPASLTTVSTTD